MHFTIHDHDCPDEASIIGDGLDAANDAASGVRRAHVEGLPLSRPEPHPAAPAPR
jgi:hypothetical protein